MIIWTDFGSDQTDQIIRKSQKSNILKMCVGKSAVWILREYRPTELFVHFLKKYKTVLFTVSKHH